ncbi:chorion class A protein L12-like [Bombyx mori]|uniref:chorion class A protein L12-like n=1 Tax=Bombyx mori TaxID=7091 RepID=UPI002ED43BD1
MSSTFTFFILCVQACLIQVSWNGLGAGWNGIDGEYGAGCGSYGGEGIGNVGVAGELPVAGTTAIIGRVPIIGAVEYGGQACAVGTVSIYGHCAPICGCGRSTIY